MRPTWDTTGLNNPLWVAGLTMGLLALEPVVKPAPNPDGSGALRIAGWTAITFLVHPYTGLSVLAVSAGVIALHLAPARAPRVGSAVPSAPDFRDASCAGGVEETRPAGSQDTARAGAGRVSRELTLRLVPGLALALGLIGGVSWWQNQDAVFHATAQGFFGDRSLSPLWYPLTLGALGVLAARGAWLRWRENVPGAAVLLAWVGIAAVLHSSPWTNGYHFVFLLHLPLCLLAVPALDSALRVFEDEAAPVARQLTAAVVLALAFQSALGITWRTTRLALAYAIPAPVMAAVQALAHEPADRIYTSPHIGTILPAYTPHRVVVGHWFLTPGHSARQKQYTDLMAGRVPPADFLAELRQDGIGFVLLPPGAPSGVAEALAGASRRVEALGTYGLFYLR